jgi:hypothetical protein
MRILRNVVLISVLAAFGGVLAGCDSLDTFQFWDTKKKLPGERKPVFPEGVPGVSQGIPPELMKGYQEPQQATNPAAIAAEETAEKEEKPQKKAEAKPKPKRTARPAPQPQNAQQQADQSPWPQQSPQQAAPQQAQQAPWPSAQPQQSPWPAAPPPGTFSR